MPDLQIDNPARRRLEAGELALGIGIRQGRTIDIARIMEACGFDWLFLDLEHGVLSLDTTAQISVAALDAGITPLVRVPIGGYSLATRILDSGAMGIVMPHVESAAEAREMVRQLRFAPHGERGVSATIPQFKYRSVPLGDAFVELNRSILLIVMLETPRAVSQADEIAAIDGIDVLMIGTNDLAMSQGRPSQYDHPEVMAAYQTVAAACERHGKWLGSGGIGDPELAARYVNVGARFFLVGHDVGLILSAGRQRVAGLRAATGS